ncbi:MAG: transketolase [Clostridia bacterium]
MNKAEQLFSQGKEVKTRLLNMIHTAQSGHPGGSLSIADIMTVLYFDELNIDPKNPKWADRDRFVLSKGHVCPVLYTCLAMRGYFGLEVLDTLRKEGSILQGHPDMKKCPGVDISTGSLGQGLSVAVGMAIAGKRDNKNYRVFSVIGDGESNEGQIWEALETAAKYELNNLILIVDNNGLQNDNICEVVMPLRNYKDKFEAFGLDVYPIDGHNMYEILDVFEKIKNKTSNKPSCILAKTVKGKGVSYMENVVAWHGTAPNDKELEIALKEIQEAVL